MPPARAKVPAEFRLDLGFFNYRTGQPWTAAEIAAEHRRRAQEAERQEQLSVGKVSSASANVNSASATDRWGASRAGGRGNSQTD